MKYSYVIVENTILRISMMNYQCLLIFPKTFEMIFVYWLMYCYSQDKCDQVTKERKRVLGSVGQKWFQFLKLAPVASLCEIPSTKVTSATKIFFVVRYKNYQWQPNKHNFRHKQTMDYFLLHLQYKPTIIMEFRFFQINYG